MMADESGWKNTNLLYNKFSPFHKISDITVNMGDGRYQFLTAALFAIPGIVFHDETAFRTGSNIAEAIISTGLLVQVLKELQAGKALLQPQKAEGIGTLSRA